MLSSGDVTNPKVKLINMETSGCVFLFHVPV